MIDHSTAGILLGCVLYLAAMFYLSLGFPSVKITITRDTPLDRARHVTDQH